MLRKEPAQDGENTRDVRYTASFPRQADISFQARLGSWFSPLFLLTADYVTLIGALGIALALRNLMMRGPDVSLSSFQNYLFGLIPMIYLGLIAYEGLYVKRLQLWESLEKLFKISLFATLLTTGLLYFEHVAAIFPRIFLSISLVSCFVLLSAERYLSKKFLVALGLWQKPVLLIGTGRAGEGLATAFADDPHIGLTICGICDANDLHPLARQYPYLGNLAQVEKVIAQHRIEEVIIALPDLKREELLDLVYRIQPSVKKISVVPDLFGLPLNHIETNTYFKQKTVTLTLHNQIHNIWNRAFKRIFDLIAGIILLIPTLPLLAILAVLIKRDSPGPAFHNARRIGRNGREFVCYKLRTMYLDSDAILKEYLATDPLARKEWAKYAKLKDYDPRVTRVGQWIRKYSLDELPQILNVLLGNMSLVGPRPYLPREKGQMKYFYETIIDSKPGITGLWQISGRNEVEFAERLSLDAWYVRNWSFWMDVAMLLKTVKVVFGKLGAY